MFKDTESTTWYKDGHNIYLQLNKNELVIQVTSCPGGENRKCKTETTECIVEWFLNCYGLDCNVGVSEIMSNMEIAWSIQGDTSNTDLCQVWVIPIIDEAFSAWLTTQETPDPNQ